MLTKSYIFTGVVHPLRARLTIRLSQLNCNLPIGTVQAKLDILNNQIVVFAEIVWAEDEDIDTLRNSVSSLVDQAVSVYDFLRGYCHSVEITSVIDLAAKTTSVFRIDMPVIAKRCLELYPDDASVQQRCGLVLNLTLGGTGWFLKEALRNLSLAIQHPSDTGFYCFRALEALRNSYKVSEGNEDKAWELLREDIEATKGEIKDTVQRHAAAARHGNPAWLSGSDRETALLKTWEWVEKFIAKRVALDPPRQHVGRVQE